MKLSEAMLKGCKGTTKCTEIYWKGKKQCCAIGAALRTIGIKSSKTWSAGTMRASFPYLFDVEVVHPTTKVSSYMFGVITDLNDNKGWSRQRIAKWLKSIGY